METRSVPAFDALYEAVFIQHHVLGVAVFVFVAQPQAGDQRVVPGEAIADRAQLEEYELILLQEQVEFGAALPGLAPPAPDASA